MGSEVFVEYMDELLETMRDISETLKKLEQNVDILVSNKNQ